MCLHLGQAGWSEAAQLDLHAGERHSSSSLLQAHWMFGKSLDGSGLGRFGKGGSGFGRFLGVLEGIFLCVFSG